MSAERDTGAPPGSTIEVCSSCGKFVDRLNSITGWCQECSGTIESYALERYLAANADSLEVLIGQGYSLWQGIELLKRPHMRPICVVCGQIMTRAHKPAIFARR